MGVNACLTSHPLLLPLSQGRKMFSIFLQASRALYTEPVSMAVTQGGFITHKILMVLNTPEHDCVCCLSVCSTLFTFETATLTG